MGAVVVDGDEAVVSTMTVAKEETDGSPEMQKAPAETGE